MGADNKNSAIQSLRCIACIMVFLSHLIGCLKDGFFIGPINMNNTPFRLIWGGNAAVIVFFVLSGFFLYKPDYKLSFTSYIYSIYKRIKRLYPIFIITITFGIVCVFFYPKFNPSEMSSWIASFWTHTSSFKQYLLTYFLVFPFNTHLVDPVIWTLQIEIRMIFVIPLMIYLIKKDYSWILYPLVFIISAVIPQLLFLPVFFIGLITKKVFTKYNFVFPAYTKVIMFILGLILLDSEYIFTFLKFKVPPYFTYILTAMGTALIIVLIYFAKIKFFNKNKFLIWLGNNSYSFYLIHFVVMLWFRFALPYIPLILYGVMCFIISCLLAFMLTKIDVFIQSKLLVCESKFTKRRRNNESIMDNKQTDSLCGKKI